jgi:hypothetical protein
LPAKFEVSNIEIRNNFKIEIIGNIKIQNSS